MPGFITPALQPPPPPAAPAVPFLTQLSPTEERQFQVWSRLNGIDKLSHTASGKPDPNYLAPDNDYDMRGYWKAQQAGDPDARRGANLHFPDTYKTPFHRSFSSDSTYALPGTPHWADSHRLVNTQGQTVFDESKAGRQ